MQGVGERAGGHFTGSGGAVLNRGVFCEAYSDNSNARAIDAFSPTSDGYAGYFQGNVNVTGTVAKAGGSFKIDHPLDPENKYLYHSFVESPDMMNVYNGNVMLDGSGNATVELPEYFESLNREFRYQLTPIGAPGPMLYVLERDLRWALCDRWWSATVEGLLAGDRHSQGRLGGSQPHTAGGDEARRGSRSLHSPEGVRPR